MKKSNSQKGTRLAGESGRGQRRVVGMDLSDKTFDYAVLEQGDEFVEEGRLPLTEAALRRKFGSWAAALFAIEAGTHSRWVERVLRELGHEVIVANPRELRALTHSHKKRDREDARKLAIYARADVRILKPVRLRSEAAQQELLTIQVRDVLVRNRTQLVNTVRGLVKGFGARVPKCTTQGFAVRAWAALPEALRVILQPLLDMIALHGALIKNQDQAVSRLAAQAHPAAVRLSSVPGVGELTALTYVLTVEDASRFRRSRDAGCYVGLRPRRAQSGESDPELGITKAGNSLLRRLLVQCAHRLLSERAPDCELRRWGLKLAAGGRKQKKRAVVAVARKLAVLLHRLWVSGESFVAFPPGQPGTASA